MNSRRAAAFVVARWIATHGHLSEMLPDGPDRAFVQDLAYTTVRRFRVLRSILGKLVTKWPKGEMDLTTCAISSICFSLLIVRSFHLRTAVGAEI